MTSAFRLRLGAVLALIAFLTSLPVFAASPLSAVEPRPGSVVAKLVSEADAIKPGDRFLVGLDFTIRDGWHTYWRFAGDSGAPTAISWTLPPGFAASDIEWPLPVEVPLGPLMDYGYEHHVLHIISITAPSSLKPGARVVLRAAADWLVCSDEVCVPESADLSLPLAVAKPTESPRPDPKWAPRIAAAFAALPEPAPFQTTTTIDGDWLALSLHDSKLAQALKSGAINKVTYFPYQDGIILHAKPQELMISPHGAALRLSASYLAKAGRLPDPLSGLVVFTKKDGTRVGYEIAATPGAPLASLVPFAPAPTGKAQSGGSGIGFAAALAFAFAGGLILNLMPCVFPVLSMKALAFIKRGDEARAELHLHGWAYTAGVMLSFVALGIGLFALRQGGATIGWGYQLQVPIVVVALAYLMFVVGLILSGVVDIGADLAGAGEKLTRRSGLSGSFFTGVLATLVAAPCTAPFMGAALGYAMLTTPALGAFIFVALGAGLALPFLVLTYLPRAFARLPRPGPWMARLKELLAFPMYATTAWLIWVLAQQTGPDGLLLSLLGLVLIALAAWALRRLSRHGSSWIGRAAALVAVVLAIGLAAFAARPADRADRASPVAGAPAQGWLPYSSEAVDQALDEGRPVFVDATAAWCLTCKVNELGALSSRPVENAFKAQRTVLLRADWTNRNPEIAALLARYNRLGVPLYLYYPGKGRPPRILPQLLTPSNVLAALRKRDSGAL